MKEWFSSKELAGLVGMPKDHKGVLRWAEKFEWIKRERPGRGGGSEYHFNSLPAETQAAINDFHPDPLSQPDPIPSLPPISCPPDLHEGLEGTYTPKMNSSSGAFLLPEVEEETSGFPYIEEIDEDELLLAPTEGQLPLFEMDPEQAKWAIVTLWRRYWAGMPEGAIKRRCREDFCDDIWKAAELIGISDEDRILIQECLLCGKKGKLSPSCLHEYERDYEKLNRNREAINEKKYRVKWGKIQTNQRLVDEIWNYLCGFLEPNVALLHERIRHEFPMAEVPSYSNLRRYCEWLERTQARKLLQKRDPDAARGKYGTAQGNQNWETQPNQRWEWDGTPADVHKRNSHRLGEVMLSDGRRYSLVNLVDKFTRRLKVLVWQSVSSDAYSILIRRGVVDWGIPEALRSDCGSAENSSRIRAGLKALGIKHEPTQQYSPDQKGTIERANQTINGWLESHPAFKGHNVAEGKALQNQVSFAQRAGGGVSRIDCTAQELQDYLDLCLAGYHELPHAGLGGRSPMQAYREALWTGWRPRKFERPELEHALQLWLLPVGSAVVGKKGIRYQNGNYIHERLGDINLEGQRVECRVDPSDKGRLFVFFEGKFICIAEDPGLTGVNQRVVAMAAKKIESQTLAEAKKQLKETQKRVGKTAHEQAQSVYQRRAEKAEKILSFPVAADPVSTPELEEAALALTQAIRHDTAMPEFTPELQELQRQMIREDEEVRASRPLEKSFDRAWRISRTAPDQIDEEDRLWWRHYITTMDGLCFLESLDRPVAI